MKSINQIEIFDTIVALLAGLMIVPAVFYLYGDRGYVCRPWSDVCLPAEGLSVHGSSRRRNRNHFSFLWSPLQPLHLPYRSWNPLFPV